MHVVTQISLLDETVPILFSTHVPFASVCRQGDGLAPDIALQGPHLTVCSLHHVRITWTWHPQCILQCSSAIVLKQHEQMHEWEYKSPHACGHELSRNCQAEALTGLFWVQRAARGSQPTQEGLCWTPRRACMIATSCCWISTPSIHPSSRQVEADAP